MRQISNELAAVQLVRSPRARVTIGVEARGQSEGVPALAWEELVSNAGQSFWKQVALCSRSDGQLLRFVGQAASVDRQRVADPTSAANWQSPTATTQPLAFAVSGLCAVRVPGSSTIRLFYARTSTGNVAYVESADDGETWGSPVTLYSSGAAFGDLVAAYIQNGTVDNGPWFFGFSTYNGGSGEYTPRFGYHDGANWVTHAYDPGWRAAGIDAYGPATSAHRVLVFRQSDMGASRLRRLSKSGASYASPFDLDRTQAGLFGLTLAYYRFFQLPESEVTGGICGESADGAGAYQGVCYLHAHSDLSSEQSVDEARIFPAAVVSSSDAFAALTDSTLEGSTSYYLAGDTFVYRGAPQAATAETLEPIRYTYGEGLFEIDLAATVPPIYVGQILRVDRTLSWGEESGTESVRVIVLRVERATDKVTLLAADALAYVGILRCRRPSILNDGGAAGLAEVMRKLVGRFGLSLAVDDASLESAAVMPMTVQPMESLLAAAYRITSQANSWLVPRNDGSFALTLINPGTSDSGDYADTPHEYGQPGNQQPVLRAAEVSDYRRLAFAYVLGTYSTDPEDGAALAMAEGPALANTKPISYSVTNSRYNTSTRVASAASAEATRQRRLSVDAVVDAYANLALELHDLVEITEPGIGWEARQFRVRAITERYEQGLLTHRLMLGNRE